MPLTEEQITGLKQRVASETEQATATRHAIHRTPELAGQEFRTQELVRTALKEIGLEAQPPLLETDVIAEIKTGSDVTVCLRADMDALPILEQTGAPYASTCDGRMHACGHDAHTAILLSTARILQERRQQLQVSVRFVFQPGEEMVAMGADLVAAGCADGCAEAYALHGRPGLPLGQICCRPGVMMATGAHIAVTFHGRGCHGSMPELGKNPIPAAAEFVLAVESLREELQTGDCAVVTPCGIDAGLSGNVIPDEARVTGTARYLSPEQHPVIRERLDMAAKAAARNHDVSYQLDYDTRYELPLINSQPGFERVRDAACRLLGDPAWHESPTVSLGMEDFAFYLKDRDGAMFWVGLGEDHPPLHRNDFDFDDRALANGILLFCSLILDR